MSNKKWGRRDSNPHAARAAGDFKSPADASFATAPRSAAILYALFAVSGFAGLIYESIWTHYLKLFLGHAAYAQTLVLAIFMGGMAIGSLYFCGRGSPSATRPTPRRGCWPSSWAKWQSARGLRAAGPRAGGICWPLTR